MRMPWIVIGDYNNMLTCQDRIGGNPVAVTEYKELEDMIHRNGLFEAPSRGCHFTWSNKQSAGTIYSWIDRIIGNGLWFQAFPDAIVEVLPPGISDHSPIRVSCLAPQGRRKVLFKFLNCVTKKEGFQDIVRQSWNVRVQGNAMHRLWIKLKRLQNPLRPLYKSFTNIQVQIHQARHDLTEAHRVLKNDLFDCGAMEQVKSCTNKFLNFTNWRRIFSSKKPRLIG
ncbi:uncharacterized protein LOC131648620 [Vicia villosa]|uniref:uncharacterized protein LOC131648620 n=1 Tax=Vicia villosa TaxID=3911 RepID=UPI00273C9322|nr:uncharacterized protein LOC131648620 [Vicia villosa]